MAAQRKTKKNQPKPKASKVTKVRRSPLVKTASTPVKSFDSPHKTISKNTSKIKLIIGLAVVVALLYILRGEFLVSTVNGKPIYRWSVINRLEKLGGESILTELTRRYVVEDELAAKGITITDEEINQEIKEARALFEAQGVNFEEALAQDNLTLEDVREISRYQKGLRTLAEDGLADVTDEELEAFYEENKEFYGEESFEDIKEQIRESLKEEKIQTRQESLMSELMQNANITVYRTY